MFHFKLSGISFLSMFSFRKVTHIADEKIHSIHTCNNLIPIINTDTKLVNITLNCMYIFCFACQGYFLKDNET